MDEECYIKAKIVVQEHCDKVVEDEIKLDCSSNVGYKCFCSCNGHEYGEYVTINKPTITASDVVEAMEYLLPKMIETICDVAEGVGYSEGFKSGEETFRRKVRDSFEEYHEMMKAIDDFICGNVKIWD